MKNEKMWLTLTLIVNLVMSQSSLSEPVTCSRPLPPENAIITLRECNGSPRCKDREDRYYENDKVFFSCKKGFSGFSPYENSITCGTNGEWFPKIENLKECIYFDYLNQFQCQNGEGISKDKRCNCDIDCQDGSDELNCPHRRKIISPTLKGKGSSGIISSPGYPRSYPRNYNCFYQIKTLPGHYIKVDFEEFDLPKKKNRKCIDSVRMTNVHPDFLPKRRKNQHPMLRIQRRSSQSKCGSNGFHELYSNSTYIGINITLGFTNSKNTYRGLSLSWEIKNQNEFYEARLKLREKLKPSVIPSLHEVTKSGDNDNDDNDNLIASVMLPILFGILPLSFILFYCYPRIVKPSCFAKKSKNIKDSVLLTLTETNLAKFDKQMGSATQTESHLLPPPEGLSSSANNEKSFEILQYQNSPSQNKNIDNESSQNSDLPRYVMSYDITMNHVPTRQSSHPSQHHSSNSRVKSNSPRSSKVSNQNLSTNSMFQTCRDVPRTTRCRQYDDNETSCSRENVIASRTNGMQSAYSSNSGSSKTCSLCHQQQRTCKPDLKTDPVAKKPQNDYYIQLIPTVYEVENLDIYGQSSRLQYMKNTYPELDVSNHSSSEYIEIAYGRESFLYSDSMQSYSPPFKEKVSISDPACGKLYPDMLLSDPDLTTPSFLHHLEKRIDIYPEEIYDTKERFLPVHSDVYGSMSQADRQKLKLHSHTLRV